MFHRLANTHTLPAAVVSGCHGDRVTTATPGPLREREERQAADPAPRLHAVAASGCHGNCFSISSARAAAPQDE